MAKQIRYQLDDTERVGIVTAATLHFDAGYAEVTYGRRSARVELDPALQDVFAQLAADTLSGARVEDVPEPEPIEPAGMNITADGTRNVAPFETGREP